MFLSQSFCKLQSGSQLLTFLFPIFTRLCHAPCLYTQRHFQIEFLGNRVGALV
ncbi:hypothetical protein Lalb_Chr24g0400731 [Lupinus albus]|uniref:Uncharacterized protein n=1 Tax=Lupinus albus TaxID=3870 RepID=A0A6A4N4L8_LUPAL|nr:hypothetical protein Lalb_Chr24g0400731 [Lupinus albus]